MTWPAFVSMGGYAVYVWSAYLLTLLALGGELLLLVRRRRMTGRVGPLDRREES
jgi:heme exporter protein CcmD